MAKKGNEPPRGGGRDSQKGEQTKGVREEETREKKRKEAAVQPLKPNSSPEQELALQVDARAKAVLTQYLASQEGGVELPFDLQKIFENIKNEKGDAFFSAVTKALKGQDDGLDALLENQSNVSAQALPLKPPKVRRSTSNKRFTEGQEEKAVNWNKFIYSDKLNQMGQDIIAKALQKIRAAYEIALQTRDYSSIDEYYKTIRAEILKVPINENTFNAIYRELMRIGADIDGSLAVGYSAESPIDDYFPLRADLEEKLKEFRSLSPTQKQEVIRILYREANDILHHCKPKGANEQGIIFKIDEQGVSITFSTEPGKIRKARLYFRGNGKLSDEIKETDLPFFPKSFKEFIDRWTGEGQFFTDAGRLAVPSKSLDSGVRKSIESYTVPVVRVLVMEELFRARPASYLQDVQSILASEQDVKKMEGYYFSHFAVRVIQDEAGVKQKLVVKVLSKLSASSRGGLLQDEKRSHQLKSEPVLQISEKFPKALSDEKRIKLAWKLLTDAQDFILEQFDKLPEKEKRRLVDSVISGMRFTADQNTNTIFADYWTVDKNGVVTKKISPFDLKDPKFLALPDIKPLKEILTEEQIKALSTASLWDETVKDHLLTALQYICYYSVIADLYDTNRDYYDSFEWQKNATAPKAKAASAPAKVALEKKPQERVGIGVIGGIEGLRNNKKFLEEEMERQRNSLNGINENITSLRNQIDESTDDSGRTVLRDLLRSAEEHRKKLPADILVIAQRLEDVTNQLDKIEQPIKPVQRSAPTTTDAAIAQEAQMETESPAEQAQTEAVPGIAIRTGFDFQYEKDLILVPYTFQIQGEKKTFSTLILTSDEILLELAALGDLVPDAMQDEVFSEDFNKLSFKTKEFLASMLAPYIHLRAFEEASKAQEKIQEEEKQPVIGGALASQPQASAELFSRIAEEIRELKAKLAKNKELIQALDAEAEEIRKKLSGDQ